MHKQNKKKLKWNLKLLLFYRIFLLLFNFKFRSCNFFWRQILLGVYGVAVFGLGIEGNPRAPHKSKREHVISLRPFYLLIVITSRVPNNEADDVFFCARPDKLWSITCNGKSQCVMKDLSVARSSTRSRCTRELVSCVPVYIA